MADPVKRFYLRHRGQATQEAEDLAPGAITAAEGEEPEPAYGLRSLPRPGRGWPAHEVMAQHRPAAVKHRGPLVFVV